MEDTVKKTTNTLKHCGHCTKKDCCRLREENERLKEELKKRDKLIEWLENRI